MDKQPGAKRLTGFDQPTVWSVMTPLAVKTKSVNLVLNERVLGSGISCMVATWFLPSELRRKPERRYYSSYLANHQYTRAFGSLPLVHSIANFHKKRFPNIDPENEILTTNGGVEALYCSIMALVDEGDEVVFFDPSYDCYRAQVQMAGGKSVGIPLMPRVMVISS